MKQILLVLMAAVVCLFASACSKQPDNESKPSDISSAASGNNSALGSENQHLEQLRKTLPHNFSIKFNDLKETVIELDGLKLDESINSYTESGTEWYSTDGNVTVNGFAFSPAIYSFSDKGKITSLTYYSIDDSAEFTTYIPEYTYTTLCYYFDSIYGERKIRTDEAGNEKYVYWEITLDGTDVYTLEMLYFNYSDSSETASVESSGEELTEYVLIAIYSSSYN